MLNIEINTKINKSLIIIFSKAITIAIIGTITAGFSQISYAGYSYQAEGAKIKCHNGACPVYPNKPSFMIGTNNSLCFRQVNQKGGIWTLSTKQQPQHAKCVFAGGYVDKDHYLYCQEGYNCEATIMGNIINLKGYTKGLPYASYKLHYNFSLFCKSDQWAQTSDSTFLCSKN
jgi:hypothetical protein